MKLSKQHELAALLPLIRLARDAAPGLPPAQKADILEGVALITRDLDKSIHRSASLAARCIRDAEAQQLILGSILMEKEAA